MTTRTLFQNRNLTLLWMGQIISQSGDSIFQIGLLWLTLEMTGSEAITGAVAMASFLPAVLLSLVAGAVADHSNKRSILIAADAFRAVVVLLIPLLFFAGWLAPGAMAAIAFALAIAATFFNPARDAFVPDIVPKAGLLRANSLIQTSWQFSLLLGPAIAGGLLHLVGSIHLFTVDAAAYFLSLLCVIGIRLKGNIAPAKKGRIKAAEIMDGVRYVFRNPVLLPLFLISVADNLFIMGPAVVGTPILVKIVLQKGAESYALIQGCYAVGMLIGTVGLFTLGHKFGKGKILLVGMILDGLTFIPIFWVNSLGMLAVVIVIHSLAIPLLTISRTSLVQDIVSEDFRGRVFSFINLAVVGMTAISAGVSGLLIELIGVKTLFLAIGIGGGACGIIGWFFANRLRQAK